jgi:neutral ceramidase
MMTKRSARAAALVLFSAGLLARAADTTFRVDSNLLAAVAKIDITPPAGLPVTGHVRPTDGFRNKLHAEALLLSDGQTKAAIVTTDLISASADLVAALRGVVAAKTGTPAENIMITASHNHSGPRWESQPDWGRRVLADLDVALAKVAGEMRPVSVGYGVDQINFNINRRALVNGKSVVRLNPDGPCDRRVKVLRLDDGRSLDPLAILMHAVCHACVHTWGDRFSPPHPGGYPQASSDFPGEARDFVERVYSGRTKAMFLQGCAGDIRPNLPGYPYRCGDEADIRWIGRNLGSAVVRASDFSVIREELAKRPKIYPLRCASKTVTLPAAKEGETVQCPLQAMKFGPYLLLTIPGEPMVEYGLRLEKAIGDRAIPIVVGYANGNLGYICTTQSFEEGGYEPAHSQAGPEAEEIIIRELLGLVDRVVGDVFEAFRPAAPRSSEK